MCLRKQQECDCTPVDRISATDRESRPLVALLNWEYWDTPFIPTVLVEKVMRSVVFVRPSVSTLSFESSDLWPCSFVCWSWESRSSWKVNAKRLSRTSIYCGVPPVLLDGRSSMFLWWRHRLRASAVGRATWRSRDQQQWWSLRVLEWYAVGLTSIFERGQFFL